MLSLAPLARCGPGAWLGLALLLGGGFTGLASAATFAVTNTSDSGPGSLRQAILDANSNPGADVVDATGVTGKIFLTSGALRLTDGVTIVGPGADRLAVSGNRHSCCQASQVFLINGGVTAAISGLSITEGVGDQGGGIFNAGTVSLSHCTLSDHRAHFNGGALYNSGGTVTITSCTLSGNAVAGGQFGEGDGGAIYSEGTVTIIDSTLAHNTVPATAGWGGAVASWSGPVTLTSTTVSGNSALVAGGVFSSDGTLTMTNCLVWGNTATAWGGGFASVSSPVTVTNCTLSGNTSGSDGPGGYSSIADTFVTNSIVWGNNGPADAQLYKEDGLTIIGHSDVQFSGGSGHWDFSIGADAGGNLDVNPQFVDAAHGDFRPLASSPVVDAGLTAAVHVPPFPVDAQGRPLDLAGHLRIVGSAVDMGAFELQALSAPPPNVTLATLIGDVEALGLPRGLERSLLASIQTAQQALERGQRTAAQHALRAFLRQLAAQRGKHLSVVHADALRSTASQVLATL